jgi:hypothetical protein
MRAVCSHVGGLGCEIQGVCPIQELCAVTVIWEGTEGNMETLYTL